MDPFKATEPATQMIKSVPSLLGLILKLLLSFALWGREPYHCPLYYTYQTSTQTMSTLTYTLIVHIQRKCVILTEVEIVALLHGILETKFTHKTDSKHHPRDKLRKRRTSWRECLLLMNVLCVYLFKLMCASKAWGTWWPVTEKLDKGNGPVQKLEWSKIHWGWEACDMN